MEKQICKRGGMNWQRNRPPRKSLPIISKQYLSVRNSGEISANIKSIKDILRNRIFKARRWKSCGIQLSLQFATNETSLIDEIILTRRRLLLREIYVHIFCRKVKYIIVYKALEELSIELGVYYQFGDLFRTPFSLAAVALDEHLRSGATGAIKIDHLTLNTDGQFNLLELKILKDIKNEYETVIN